ncbi:alpha/beta hydrolase [Microbacterium sp. NPDC089189]|uniref:alpha/beta fold hydrolase n=1 Tax=Microbacterium sp. NPDC089189 TaxID=3154972 RepID=UPI00341BCCE6
MHENTTRGALRTDEPALGLTRRVLPGPDGAALVVRTGRRRPGATSATVLLHGAAGSWSTWTPLLTASDRRGAPLTDVVIPDLPGWGESAGPVPDIAEVSARIAGAVRALGYTRWHVVGHSMGGFLALDLAAREPDATVEVGLVSPSGPGVQLAARHRLSGAARVPGFGGMMAIMGVLRALGGPGLALVRLLERIGMLRLLASPLFAHPRRVDGSVIRALSHEVRPTAFAAATRMSADYDETRWRAIRSPMRSVRGERDVFASADEATQLARLLPGLRETRLRGAGHFAHIEQPAATLAALGLGRRGAPVQWSAYRVASPGADVTVHGA